MSAPKPWLKHCPLCAAGANTQVNERNALAHLRQHGVMFRVSREAELHGLPAESFDELCGFVKRLEKKNLK